MIIHERSGSAAVVVGLDEAKEHLRVSHSFEDDLITSLVASATEHVSSICGLVLGTETWVIRTGKVSGALLLPISPVQTLVSIGYVDADGSNQSADTNDFLLIDDLRRPTLRPNQNASWPAAAYRPDAITITVVAGMLTLPASLRAAILLITAHLYRHREAVTADSVAILPLSVDALIEPWKRLWVAG